MGYRYNMPTEPPNPENHLMRFDVRNGAVMKVAFDCRYFIKDAMHPMWVWPRYVGDIAVARRSNGVPYYRIDDLEHPYETEPINLFEEFGEDAIVQIEFEDNLPVELGKIESYGFIDSESVNVVKIFVKTDFPAEDFDGKPIENHFTVFVADPNNSFNVDAVCHGILTVLPGRTFEIQGSQDINEEATNV